MQKREQRRFIKELCLSIEKIALRKIAEGKIPESWNGIELREYVADLADDCRPGKVMDRHRRKEYNNTININNL